MLKIVQTPYYIFPNNMEALHGVQFIKDPLAVSTLR